jgi:hypothetical protein
VSHRFSDFLMASSFFNSNNCSRSVLAKNWRLCIQLAASRMQIVPAWPPGACNMNKITEICMRLAATRVQFACDWRPLRYNLHATGSHSVTRQETSRQEVCKRPSLHHIYIFLALASPHPRRMLPNFQPLDIWFGKCAGTMDDIATRKQILHALAASCVQSRTFFASTLREQLFELKNEDAIKKSENLRHTCP